MIRNRIVVVSFFLLFNCGPAEDLQDDYIILSETELEIPFKEVVQLHAKFERDGYTSADLEWESEVENIASVDQNGLVTGVREGTTNILVRTADRVFTSICEVRVRPTNFMFKEPYFDFGEDQAFILKKEERQLSVQIPDAMVFNGENQNIRYLNYRFKDGKYFHSFVVLPGRTEIQIQLLDFIRQRYDLQGFFLNRYHFDNEHRSVTWAYDTNLDIVLMYFPKDN